MFVQAGQMRVALVVFAVLAVSRGLHSAAVFCSQSLFERKKSFLSDFFFLKSGPVQTPQGAAGRGGSVESESRLSSIGTQNPRNGAQIPALGP